MNPKRMILTSMRKGCMSYYFLVNSHFRKHYCNVMFPHIRQQPPNKMEEDHQQAITGRQRDH